MRAAGIEHVLRADDIGLVVTLVAAPSAGLGRVVEDCVHAQRGSAYRVRIGEIAAHLAHADRIELGVVPAIEAGDVMTAFDEAAAQGLAEEAAATGNQDPHCRLHTLQGRTR